MRIELDRLRTYGHPNVLAHHPTTIEFTKEDFLTLRGDCIVGINSTKSCSELSPALKSAITAGKQIFVTLQFGNFELTFSGWGHPDLELTSQISMVFRKSDFISDRTILIRCDTAAKDLDRRLITYMKDPSHVLEVIFYVEDGNQ
jgi:hypothetical protein